MLFYQSGNSCWAREPTGSQVSDVKHVSSARRLRLISRYNQHVEGLYFSPHFPLFHQPFSTPLQYEYKYTSSCLAVCAKVLRLHLYYFSRVLIKTDRSTCEIIVLMFSASKKLCSVQTISQTCAGKRDNKQTNKQGTQNVSFFHSLSWLQF